VFSTILINVDELWLKGDNRAYYYSIMKRNISQVVRALHPHKFSCVNQYQRLFLKSSQAFSSEVMDALSKVSGIHSLIPAIAVPLKLDKIMEGVDFFLSGQKLDNLTFKIRASRSNKQFPQTSMEIAREIGHQVLVKYPALSVDVKRPNMYIDVRVLDDKIYVSQKNILGPGGLPVGTSGHIITLISGGFDSPVASYLMSKRGCRQTFAFFYAYPFVGEEVKNKILKLMEVISQYQIGCDLYIIPFGDIQNTIAKNCWEEYRTILFRKYMIEVAALLAKRIRASAILTGDSLGQVSSQTITNISVLDQLSPLPIFRPLLGHNKAEIIEISRQVGFHDISTIPHDDACALFAPKHPTTKADFHYVKSFYENNPWPEILDAALNQSEIFHFTPLGIIASAKPKIK